MTAKRAFAYSYTPGGIFWEVSDGREFTSVEEAKTWLNECAVKYDAAQDLNWGPNAPKPEARTWRTLDNGVQVLANDLEMEVGTPVGAVQVGMWPEFDEDDMVEA